MNRFNIFTLLLCMAFLVSCTGIKSYETIRISNDSSVIDVLKNKAEIVKSFNADLDLIPSAIGAPKIGAFMSYNREGMFRLAGLTPNGFSLFDFESQDDRFTFSLSDRIKISGDMNDFRSGFKAVSGSDLPVDPDIVRETIDFYGIDRSEDTLFFIEELRDYYILSQLKSEGNIAYPVRRWYIDTNDKQIFRKEVFSGNPDKRGEIVMEAAYGDFRMVDNILTPYEILIKEGRGKKLLKMKFNKVEYNR